MSLDKEQWIQSKQNILSEVSKLIELTTDEPAIQREIHSMCNTIKTYTDSIDDYFDNDDKDGWIKDTEKERESIYMGGCIASYLYNMRMND